MDKLNQNIAEESKYKIKSRNWLNKISDREPVFLDEIEYSEKYE